MLIELAHYLLILSLGISVGQIFLGFVGGMYLHVLCIRSTINSARLQFILTISSFILLIVSFIQNDFSARIVFEYSNINMPLIYRIGAMWGSYEGSQFLWLMILSLYGFSISCSKRLGLQFKSLSLAILSSCYVLFLLFLLLLSNPFVRSFVDGLESGVGLNPLLQDLALMFHPPLLYLGYVGSSVLFSFVIAGAIQRQINRRWVELVYPWFIFTWLALSLGIAVGSYWAYYELGWGGFWFWDPVENSSLLPWLTCLGLLHSLRRMYAGNGFKRWIMFFSCLSFIFSVLGLFLTRSGILISVHSFVSDYKRGIFILTILFIIIISAFLIVLFRGKEFVNRKHLSILGTDGFILIFNIVLLSLSLTILLGTTYPIVLSFFNPEDKISVGAPFFNKIVDPIFLLSLLLIPFAFERHLKRFRLGQMFVILGVIYVTSALILKYYFNNFTFTFSLSLTVFWWILLYFIFYLLRAFREGRFSYKLLYLSLIHLSVILIVIGIVGATVLKKEFTIKLKVDQIVEINDLCFRFSGVDDLKGKNYTSKRANFGVYEKNCKLKLFSLDTTLRRYDSMDIVTTESGIKTTFIFNYYVALAGLADNKGFYNFRIYVHPLVSLLIFGVFMLISLVFIRFIIMLRLRMKVEFL